MVQEVPYWSAPFTAGTWFNFAYDIDVCALRAPLIAVTDAAFIRSSLRVPSACGRRRARRR